MANLVREDNLYWIKCPENTKVYCCRLISSTSLKTIEFICALKTQELYWKMSEEMASIRFEKMLVFEGSSD